MHLKEEQNEKEENLIPTKHLSSKRLKICHISDTHNHHDELAIPECDVLACSGDISMLGQRKEVERFFTWFKRQVQATYKILVVGNHDLTFDPKKSGYGHRPDWLNALITEFRGFAGEYNNFYLENESCEIWGVKFWGSPQSSWFHGEKWCFNIHRGKDSFNLYSSIPLNTDVVITHGPPFGKNDWCQDVRDLVGCEDLQYHIKRVKPLLSLSGHIHESYGYTYDENTHYFNGSNLGLDYFMKNKPWLIDADFDNKEITILNQNT